MEVKGIQGSACSFMLTANEHRLAQSDPSFVLAAVLQAKAAPLIRRFTGAEIFKACEFEPITFRVSLKEPHV